MEHINFNINVSILFINFYLLSLFSKSGHDSKVTMSKKQCVRFDCTIKIKWQIRGFFLLLLRNSKTKNKSNCKYWLVHFCLRNYNKNVNQKFFSHDKSGLEFNVITLWSLSIVEFNNYSMWIYYEIKIANFVICFCFVNRSLI